MAFPRNRVLLLCVICLFTLAGCFRQASDANVPLQNAGIDPQNNQLPATPTAEALDATAELLPGDLGTGNVTEIPMTVQADATFEPLPFEPQETATEAQILEITETALPPFEMPTQAPSVTPTEDLVPLLPATETPTVQPTNTPLVVPTETPRFVTPLPLATQPIPASPTSAPAAQTSNTPSGLVTPTDDPSLVGSQDGCTYIVQSGDTFYRIAINNNLTTAQLAAANPQINNPDLINPGDEIIIPGCGVGVDLQGESTPQPPAGGSDASSGQTTHVVQQGETLYSIAQRYGVTVQAIVDANQGRIPNPNLLSPGQELIIPVSGS